ncbi:MAG: LTA synthase family protein [Bacilli bacterium]|nr:LTA synthase family protein [Bacilli bacterium]MDD4795593.1 LTA synthase family protein [Bacilli bacterium]
MKQKLKSIVKSPINFIKYNRQFSSYVVLSLLCCLLLRFYTLGNISNWQPLLIDLAFIVVFGSFGFFYKPQKQFSYYLILMLIYTTMGVVNSIYYAFYNSYASFSLLTALGQVGEVGDAVFDKMKLVHFVYLIFPVMFIIVHKNLSNRDYFNFIAKFEKGQLLFGKTLIIGLAILGVCATTLSATAFSRLSKQWNREYIVSTFGIVAYQTNDLFNTLKPKITSMFGFDVALKNFHDYYEDNQRPQSKNEYTGIYKNKNLVFIHLESISTFLIDLDVNGTVITPNLNKIASEGLYFKNFYPQVGVGTSSDTEFTLNTSLMPVTTGTVFVNYFDRAYVTIPNLLKDKGYYTFSMHANKASMWNRDKMHPSLGYMDFYSKTSFEIDEEIGLGLTDKSFFGQLTPILKGIESNNTNYMGTIISLSNHTPFKNHELFTPIDLTSGDYPYLEDTKLGDYIRSSHYADEALGEFFSYINESEYFDDTVFVLYGDHDPKLSLKIFNNYHNYNFETGEIYTEEDEEYISYDYYSNELNRKTPLIIWSKNNKLAKEVDYYMGMIDVMPTLGNMFGFYNPYAIGHDIFEIKNDNIIVFPNGNYLTNKLYYNNSKEEYRAMSLDETLSEDYLRECKDYADSIIELSNGIIIHNLIKEDLEKGN